MSVPENKRPSLYGPEIADTICERLSLGQSLREICRDAGMPNKATVLRWLAQDEGFRQRYAQAREVQADHFADEILEIADDGRNDWMERNGDEGGAGMAANHEHIQRSKLRIDSRKWLMSKVAPKKYGDRILQEHSGPDGEPIKMQLTDMERAKALAALIARTQQQRA